LQQNATKYDKVRQSVVYDKISLSVRINNFIDVIAVDTNSEGINSEGISV